MFNKLREAILVAEEKEFEESALGEIIAESCFDDEIAAYMKADMEKITIEESVQLSVNDASMEFVVSESEESTLNGLRTRLSEAKNFSVEDIKEEIDDDVEIEDLLESVCEDF